MNYASSDLRARYRRTRRLAAWLTFEAYLSDPTMYDRAYHGRVIVWEDMAPFTVLSGLGPVTVDVSLN